MKRLAALERLSVEEMREYQASRVRAALAYAFEHSPYYRERWLPSDLDLSDPIASLQRLPTTDKRTLQQHGLALTAVPRVRRVTSKTTGGSTGQAVTVLKDRGALACEMAASWHAYRWFGVQRGDRAARFWGDPFTLRRKLRYAAADFAMNRLRFSAFAFDAAALEKYWQQTLRFRPDYLYGYTSMLAEFARFVQERGYDGRALNLKVVISTSEVLTDVHERLLTDTFGCAVQNEYGCGEVGPVAYTCERGTLHVMSSNVFLEVIGDDGMASGVGEAGELVITDLNNRAMPLVRYRVGDFGVRAGPCSCGRPFPPLERIFGRAYDFVVGLDDRRFHGEFFMYLFEELRQRGHRFEQFQVIQQSPTQVRADIVSNDGDIAALAAHLGSRLAEHLPGVALSVRRVPSIQRAASGKMRVIVNEAFTDRIMSTDQTLHAS